MPRGEITLDEFTRECETLGDAITADMTPVLEQCAEVELLGQFEENFRNSRSADGQAWPPRKDPRPTHPLLILSGDLFTAATFSSRMVDKHTVEAGVMGTIPYAAAQQYGTEHILPRPYVNFSTETADAIQTRIADFILEQIT